MVYELDDSGERVRLDVTDSSELGNLLHPDQVFVIVREDIRRIFIWKGAKSSVRKRFISSRVAQALQEELVKVAAYHRCKIVSVDQGSEVTEFLKAFNLESMPVTEKLADMRYIRNVDRERMLDQGIIPDEGPKIIKVNAEDTKAEEYSSPALKENEKKIETSIAKNISTPKKASAPIKTTPYKTPPQRSSYSYGPSSGISGVNKKKIMEKILKIEIPKDYKRLNLILGHTLYGAVSKTVQVFGKNIKETEWQQVKKVPKNVIEIDNHKIRAYFDHEKGIVEAIEILEKKNSKASTTVKKTTTQRPPPKKKNAQKTPSKKQSSKNPQEKNIKATGSRKLPKIPKA